MKALGILAGPRRGQTTDSLIDAALKGLKDRGAQTEKIYLYDLDIRSCRGCMACWRGDKCVIDDDYDGVLDKMGNADVVVFGSPVYFSNVTSVAKVFMDRGVPFFRMTAFGPRRTFDKPSKVILVTSCGAPFPLSHMMGAVPGCLRPMKKFFGMMKAKIRTVVATGMENFDPKKCRRALKKAYLLGKKWT